MATRASSTKTAPKKTATKKSAKKTSERTAAKRRSAPSASAQKKSPRKAVSAASTPADSVDEQLERYRSMRDFAITDEPSGSGKEATRKAAARTALPRVKASGGLPFVIQKHAASHLHYDFRLGWAGVLKSWAVAKGPSFYPGDRRLAVQVEDHPMEYGGFEGIIPKGQYGGGTVMVWDQGTWWPQPGHENVEAGLREGSLKFEMHGTKMKGKWTLVRMGPRSTSSSGSRWGSSDKPNWLLIKEHDPFERGPNDPPITETEPNSAVTGRTMDQIAQEEDHVWNSKDTAGTGRAWYRRGEGPGARVQGSGTKTPVPKSKTDQPKPGSHNGARSSLPSEPLALDAGPLSRLPKEHQPDFLAPQLALEATTPPEGSGWLHELKLDGYRIQARKSGSKVQLLTRKGLDWTHRMKPVADAVAALPVDKVTLDGEVCVVAADGTTSFADLQAWFQNGDPATLTYFVFDLLHLNGHNTRELPLRERKQLLAQILEGHTGDNLRLSEHIETGGAEMFHKACELHAEGIVSKLADAPYSGKRSSAWLKCKCLREQEFVIAGFTDSTEGPDRIGSLLLGYYDHPARTGASSPGSPANLFAGVGTPDSRTRDSDQERKLIYAGRTGTGFTQKLKRELRSQLNKLERKTPAFARIPAEARRDAHWVEPKLVAQVRFATWTADNLVRQAAFLGLREDKSPTEVCREEPTVSPQPKAVKNAIGQKFAITPRGKTAASLNASASVVAKTITSKADAKSSAVKNTKKTAGSNPSPIHLTHPDKILDPESQLTKRDLADYYAAIADRMLPHIADRPLSLVRCPEGAGKPCFYQKHVNHMLPPGIGSVMVVDKKSGKPEPYITLNTTEAIIGMAQMGVLEIHPWGSTNDDLEHPDRLIFDLDPDESLSWQTLTAAAAEVRQRLKKAGLTSFLKTTGGKGLHVIAPIAPEHTWAEVKEAAHRLVLAMEHDNPTLFLTKMTKAARTGKIYLDYLRNERGATAVAPYSPRARVGAPVSLPLPWSALDLPKRPIFPVKEFSEWRDRLRSDPWKALPATNQSLDLAKF